MRFLALLMLLAPLHIGAVEETPGAAVSALWKAMSHEPGGRADAATLQRLFHQDAVIFGGRYKDGVPVIRRSEAEDFIPPHERVQEKGFHECEIARTLHAYDRFAVAYSVVESRADKAAQAPDFVGVNSVQLYKVGEQWTILSLYYHVEKQGVPVDPRDGRSGRCIG